MSGVKVEVQIKRSSGAQGPVDLGQPLVKETQVGVQVHPIAVAMRRDHLEGVAPAGKTETRLGPGPGPDRIEPAHLAGAEGRVDVHEVDGGGGEPAQHVQVVGQEDAFHHGQTIRRHPRHDRDPGLPLSLRRGPHPRPRLCFWPARLLREAGPHPRPRPCWRMLAGHG